MSFWTLHYLTLTYLVFMPAPKAVSKSELFNSFSLLISPYETPEIPYESFS